MGSSSNLTHSMVTSIHLADTEVRRAMSAPSSLGKPIGPPSVSTVRRSSPQSLMLLARYHVAGAAKDILSLAPCPFLSGFLVETTYFGAENRTTFLEAGNEMRPAQGSTPLSSRESEGRALLPGQNLRSVERLACCQTPTNTRCSPTNSAKMEDDELQAIRAARMAELRGGGGGGASSGGPSGPSGKLHSLPI